MGMLDVLLNRQQGGVLGLLSMPQPQQSEMARPEPKEARVNPILEGTSFANAMTRLGVNLMANAAQPGATTLGALGAAGNTTIDQMDKLQQNNALLEIQRAKAGGLGYGVQSQGFEGDIARAIAVTRNPNASAQDKAIAQGVLDTAARLVPHFNSTTGAFQNVPKAVLPGGGGIESPLVQETDLPPAMIGADPGPVPLLPPPDTSGGSFSDTPAAAKARYQKGLELELAKDKQNLEQQGSADNSAANAEYMLSELRDGKAALANFDTGLFAPVTGKVAQARAAMGDAAAEPEAQAFETINRVSKKLGAEGLKAFGGSDTEMELKVAIETSVDSQNRPQTNQKIFEKQIAAMEILAKRPEMLAQYGGDASNPEFKRAWRDFQKSEFSKAQSNAPAENIRVFNRQTGRLE